jgi:hypothetical protein
MEHHLYAGGETSFSKKQILYDVLCRTRISFLSLDFQQAND